MIPDRINNHLETRTSINRIFCVFCFKKNIELNLGNDEINKLKIPAFL